MSPGRGQGRIAYIQNGIFVASLSKGTLDMNYKKVIHAKRIENHKTRRGRGSLYILRSTLIGTTIAQTQRHTGGGYSR